MATTVELDGVIASAGFASGDRVVVGLWDDGPLGGMRDVMWARPDGMRVLVAPDAAVAAFVTGVYRFDEVIVAPFRGRRDARAISLDAGPLAVRLAAARGVPFPPRPAWVTRHVEAPIARRWLGVEPYGRSPAGVREWYRVSRYRPVTWARLRVDGMDAGGLRSLRPPLRVGFSEPPPRPSVVTVRPRLVDDGGALERALLSAGARPGGARRCRR